MVFRNGGTAVAEWRISPMQDAEFFRRQPALSVVGGPRLPASDYL